MKLVAVVCSKNRVKELSTSALPFVKSLGVDYFIVVEPQEKEAYLKVVELDKLIVLEKSNQGLGYALKSAKEEVLKRGYDAIFKIDDDVRGLLNIDGVSIKKDLPKICQALEKFPTAAAVCFPYDFEWYAAENKLFSRINKRIQTCYIIKVKHAFYDKRVSTFEDFWQFLNIRNHNLDTLYCHKYLIHCKPVGKAKGGLQDFDRSKLALKEINLFKQIDPSVQVIEKPDKPWRYEPKLVGKKYKSRKL